MTPMGIKTIIRPREKDLGGFGVRRALPSANCRTIGPFVFFDHFGPVQFQPGQGIDVRPHPHVCLSTLTYLFEGEIVHRDSLGVTQAIRPAEVNWMTAGRGIVHSERTSDQLRESGWSDGEILEINQVVAYFHYANRTVLGLGVTLESTNIGLSPGDSDNPDNWTHQ